MNQPHFSLPQPTNEHERYVIEVRKEERHPGGMFLILLVLLLMFLAMVSQPQPAAADQYAAPVATETAHIPSVIRP